MKFFKDMAYPLYKLYCALSSVLSKSSFGIDDVECLVVQKLPENVPVIFLGFYIHLLNSSQGTDGNMEYFS
jgi:hypothetical protein